MHIAQAEFHPKHVTASSGSESQYPSLHKHCPGASVDARGSTHVRQSSTSLLLAQVAHDS